VRGPSSAVAVSGGEFTALPGAAAGPRSEVLSVLIMALFIAAAGYDQGQDSTWRQVQFLATAAAVVYWGIRHQAIVAHSLNLCWPLLVLTVIGVCVTVTDGTIFQRDTLKGLWYATRLPVYITFGALLALRIPSLRWISNVLLLAGALLAIHFLLTYYSDPNAAGGGREYIRSQIGHGNLTSAFAVVLAYYKFFIEKDGERLSGALVLAATAIMAGSIILADSRSHLYGQLLLLFFVFGIIPSAFFGRMTVLAAVLCLFVLTTPALSQFVSPGELTAISEGLPEALKELVPIDRLAASDINNFWRGYETYHAFSYVTREGPAAILFGIGLHGAVIIPNTPPHLGEPLNNAIPIFHNGFSFAFVRGGLVGLILFMWQHVLLASRARPLISSHSPDLRFFGRFYCGVMILMIAEIPTTTGLLNYDESGSTSCISLGFLIGLGWILRRQAASRLPNPVKPLAFDQLSDAPLRDN
jgi:hypothetical protein